MRLHFQTRPWDLFVCIGYTTIIGIICLVLDVGNYLAVLVVLFVPGYLLVAALFPSNREIDWLERIALSLGLSLAVIPLISLTLALMPFGIHLRSVVVAFTTFTILVGAFAYRRRLNLPTGDRPSVSFEIGLPDWHTYTRLEKLVTCTLAVGVVVASGAIVYLLTTPSSTRYYTEFYLLDCKGNSSEYPSRLNASEPATVLIGIVNHEATEVGYRVVIDLIGVQVAYNATSGTNQTLELNRTTWSRFNITVEDEGNWTRPYTFSISEKGLWKVQFLLFKEEDLLTPYRLLHLYITTV